MRSHYSVSACHPTPDTMPSTLHSYAFTPHQEETATVLALQVRKSQAQPRGSCVVWALQVLYSGLSGSKAQALDYGTRSFFTQGSCWKYP